LGRLFEGFGGGDEVEVFFGVGFFVGVEVLDGHLAFDVLIKRDGKQKLGALSV